MFWHETGPPWHQSVTCWLMHSVVRDKNERWGFNWFHQGLQCFKHHPCWPRPFCNDVQGAHSEARGCHRWDVFFFHWALAGGSSFCFHSIPLDQCLGVVIEICVSDKTRVDDLCLIGGTVCRGVVAFTSLLGACGKGQQWQLTLELFQRARLLDATVNLWEHMS